MVISHFMEFIMPIYNNPNCTPSAQNYFPYFPDHNTVGGGLQNLSRFYSQGLTTKIIYIIGPSFWTIIPAPHHSFSRRSWHEQTFPMDPVKEVIDTPKGPLHHLQDRLVYHFLWQGSRRHMSGRKTCGLQYVTVVFPKKIVFMDFLG